MPESPIVAGRSVTFMASNNLLIPTLTLVFRDKSAASQRDQLGGTKWLSIFRPLVARRLRPRSTPPRSTTRGGGVRPACCRRRCCSMMSTLGARRWPLSLQIPQTDIHWHRGRGQSSTFGLCGPPRRRQTRGHLSVPLTEPPSISNRQPDRRDRRGRTIGRIGRADEARRTDGQSPSDAANGI